ncbi:Pre-mRNA-splicing factor cwc24 [Penicillium digitatum]|uniref:Pre-mRNA-splicing factor CWC24 n=3 Tax=Penicillium digitatum TaxID=36651 RepID=K9FXK5_PEND2|nr:Pre-mRNA-splicing factor cwc24 [Penicillium digitatum Pd1]EKV12389.1 Pre-mRNA-splicing factor cwc24 [Penicillium digitatum Pd1]EKV14425.1 Pre-mRNA-splicing factor cwc24 [Penicillium digitatum PHI26]QQK43188.1 Pre-mRNA-splicing factor cwc24 [Penicillium digitatum]
MGEETEIANAVPQVAFKKRSKGKANFRKKPATPPPASDSDSDFVSSDDDEGRRIKRRRRNVAVAASSTSNATRNQRPENGPITAVPAPLTSSNDATKASNWYDENLSEKNLLGTTREKPTSSASQPDGTYKGAANYQSFIQKNPDAPGKFGPLKAATNVRTITVTDFAPDVCKDWKQTGYCGFGDSCKYLHSREAYKAGWELDRDWEVNTKGKQLSGRVVSQRKGAGKIAEEEDDDDEDELLESIPFACIICLKPYQEPIITKCGHYFCEACALQRYRKTPSCAACGEGTGGVFNVAKKLKTLLNKKRERARKIREEAIANGEDVSDLEEGDDRD